MDTKYVLLSLLVLLSALQVVEVEGEFCDDFPTRNTQTEEVHFTQDITYSSTLPVVSPQFSDNSHDLIEGNCTDVGDDSEYFGIDDCNVNYFGGILTVVYGITPIPNFPNETVVIYCVTMLDRAEDGTGGYPFIESGGPGDVFVVLGMNSQVDQGLKFSTKVYVRTEHIEE